MAAQLSENWWKSAWTEEALKSDGEMRKALKGFKSARRGLSVVDLRASIQTILELCDTLDREARQQFKKSNMKLRAATRTLTQLRKAAEAAESAAKPDTTPVSVFKRPFGFALAEEMGEGHFKTRRFDVELKVLKFLADEIRARNGEAMLNNALNREFDAVVKKCAAMLERKIKALGGVVKPGNVSMIENAVKAVTVELQEPGLPI